METFVIQWLERVIEAEGGLTALTGRADAMLSLATDPVPLVLAGAVLVIIGAVVVIRIRSTGTRGNPDDRSSDNLAGDGTEERSTHVSFEEEIGETTLERLEPIIPDAVDREGDNRNDRELERELRRALMDALSDGRLEVGLSTPNGDPYDIVNLPARYREVPLPPSGQPVHVEEVDAAVRDLLENGSLRDAAVAAAAVDDHREEIYEHVRRHEAEIIDLRNEIDATVGDVRELIARLDGPLANRVEEFVLDGRHDDVDGVAEIERDVSDAMYLLQRCSFEDAQRDLQRAREAADKLLVVVDFLGGLVGTVEHGNGTVKVPTTVSTALVSDLAPIIEQQYDIDATVDGTEIAVSERKTPSNEGNISSTTDEATPASRRTSANELTDGSTATTGSRNHIATESVADEILFVLREFNGSTDDGTVQCQTERLPEGIAQPAVLKDLAAFCRRQTDVVATVDLQEGAPPGFLELEFTDRTTARGGLETLRERFVERHGS